MEGTKSPLFLYKMMDKITVERLVKEAIDENQDLFLISLTISSANKILVIADGDKGLPLKECMRISRHVEHNLDREVVDFSLEVASPGAAEPIVNNRQYNKNIGRTLKVKTEAENFEGKLTSVTSEGITLEWKVREPKPIGKGKITVLKTENISFNRIKQAKVKLKY